MKYVAVAMIVFPLGIAEYIFLQMTFTCWAPQSDTFSTHWIHFPLTPFGWDENQGCNCSCKTETLVFPCTPAQWFVYWWSISEAEVKLQNVRSHIEMVNDIESWISESVQLELSCVINKMQNQLYLLSSIQSSAT